MSGSFNQPQNFESSASDVAFRRVALVGNGPVGAGASRLIDECDLVVRFNKALGWKEDAGRKLDVLYLINHGGQMAEWLESNRLSSMDQIASAKVIALPVPLLAGHITGAEAAGRKYDVDQVNFVEEAATQFQSIGKALLRHVPADYERAVRRLQAYQSDDMPLYPSTGFLALSRMLDEEPSGTKFHLWGFGFKGWRGHPWQAEQAVVSQLVAEGNVTLHQAIAAERPTAWSQRSSPTGADRSFAGHCGAMTKS